MGKRILHVNTVKSMTDQKGLSVTVMNSGFTENVRD